MKPLLVATCAAAALTLAAALPSQASLDFANLPAFQATHLDTLRARAEEARFGRDWALAARLQREFLSEHPGDGFMLREIVLVARDRDSLALVAERLDRGDMSALPADIRFSRADVAFLRGLAATYRGRYRSAGVHFDEACAARRDWGWGQLYLARTRHDLLLPRDAWEPGLSAALRATDSRAETISFLAARRAGRDFLDVPAGVEDALRRIAVLPQYRDHSDLVELRHVARESRLSPSQCDSIWTAMRTRHGIRATHEVPSVLSRHAAEALPGREARDLISKLLQDAPYDSDCQGWLSRLDATEGRPDAACRRLEAAGAGESWLASMYLQLAGEDLDAMALRAAAFRLASLTMAPSRIDIARQALAATGLTREADSLRDLARLEDPADELKTRLDGYVATDANLARALIDSLSSAGIAPYFLDDVALTLAESLGDTLSVPAVLARRERLDAAQLAITLAGAAFQRGDAERGERLARAAMDHLGSESGFLRHVGFMASTAGRTSLAREVTARYRDLCDDCVESLMSSAVSELTARDTAAGLRFVRQAAATPGICAQDVARLAMFARAARADSTADSLMTRAMSMAPDSRRVRASRAAYLLDKGHPEEAMGIVTALLAEFPGHEAYLELARRCGGNAERLDAMPDASAAAESDAFAPLHHDFAGTDWIMARRDTTGAATSDGIVLLEQSSYLCETTESYLCRTRQVVQILNDDGVSAYSTMRIAFRPDEGLPVVRVARVILADGRVIDVPKSDILITAARSGEADVSDSRELVVPFAGLEKGAVIDFAWDETNEGIIGSRWSFRALAGAVYPTRECIVEVRARQGLPLSFHESAGVPKAAESVDGAYQTRRWTLHDLPPLVLEDDATPVIDALPWVGCTTWSSWEEAGDAYRRMFWPPVVTTDAIRSAARECTRGSRGDAGKLDGVLRMMSEKVRYLAIQLGRGTVVPAPADEVLRRGYGDCKEMVALAIALLDASGIESEPILVTPRPGVLTVPGFVEMAQFTHVILSVPGIGGGIFVDPTASYRCTRSLPVDESGLMGLAVPRSGRCRLVTLPEARAEDHGLVVDIDVRPKSEREATITVRGSYRGMPAEWVTGRVQSADSAATSEAVDRILAFGLWKGLKRETWAFEAGDCGTVRLEATYIDTVWSTSGENSVQFGCATEVADPFIAYPDDEDRKSDVLMPFPFADTVSIRLHDAGGWEASRDIVALSVKGKSCSGALTTSSFDSNGTRGVLIRQTFRLDRHEIPLSDYGAFRKDWWRLAVGVHQRYQYRRAFDAVEVKRMESYTERNPEDHGFAIQAARNLLGKDIGGEGESGLRRRDAAERLLRGAAARPGSGAMPCMLLAAIEMKRGRYRAADSLAGQAAAREPASLAARGLSVAIKNALDDSDAEISGLREMCRSTGDEETELRLIRALVAGGRAGEADREAERWFALHGDADSSGVLLARMAGLFERGDCDGLRVEMERLRSQVRAEIMTAMDAQYYTQCDDLARAAEFYEKLLEENPLDPVSCNNLAWVNARRGHDLERAEELARASIVLSSDPAGARNTLGAVLARRGDWRSARRIFAELRDADDRPSNQVVNDYFLGLCDYEMGQRREAVERWRKALELVREVEWRERIARSLELAETGGRVADPIFVPVAGP